MSKLHSDAFAKLEHVLLSFEYAFFIRVWSLHLCMLFSFGYGLCIWVCSFHLGMVFAFDYGLCIWVWSFYIRHAGRERKLASPNMELFSVNSMSAIIFLLASFACMKQRPKREHQKL